MSKVKEIAWPEEFSEFKRIEELMICGICYEYMDTAVITPCSHNYCSLCIRKYLHYKAQCPLCFHVFFEKDLYVNRTMDGIIQHFIQMREKVLILIQNRKIYNTAIQQQEQNVVQQVEAPKTPSTPPIRPIRNRIELIPKSPSVLETSCSVKKSSASNSSSVGTSVSSISSPSTSRSPNVIPSIAKIFSTPKRKEVVLPILNVKTVSCPVCSVDISEHHINVHLDACLKREVNEGNIKEKVNVTKRPPFPKLVLRVMKDAELRKKMKEFGLSTQGDRRALENRFTRYSTIYNAECDKIDPRPISELIRQCEMEEKQERKMDSFLVAASSTTTARLQIERNAKEEKIEEAHKNYREAHKSSFDKLVEEVRNRRKIEKAEREKASLSNLTSTTSTDTEIISESEEISINPSNNIAFQDSDSDESCPLQHYRSDDPVSRYLSTNLNDSGSCTSASGSPLKNRENFLKINESKANLENTSSSPFNLSTDDSTDCDIPNSPVLNKSVIRKKVKLSNKSLSKSTSIASLNSTLTKDSSIVKDDQETVARELCNSIINDFTFDDISNTSSNEFLDKHPKVNTNQVEDAKKDLNSMVIVNNASEETKNGMLLDKSLSKSMIDHSLLLNSDDSVDFVAVLDSKSVENQNPGEVLDKSLSANNVMVEKENNASTANENCQSTTIENKVRRPIRKRNCPARYVDNQNIKREDKQKPVNLDDSYDSESSSYKNPAISDNSFKRRRGRQKTTSVDHPSDEIQNPPKRPVRKRQTNFDHN